jgi:ACS family hexuronate transporter-like MFS transporter
MTIAKGRALAGPTWSVIALATLAQAHMAVGSQGIPILAVFVQRDFGLTRAELGAFSSVAQTGACISMLVGGWMADVLGVRRAIVVGLGLIGLALATLTVSTAFLWALPFLFLAGIGNGIASPAITLSILHWLPFHMRGIAMGVKQTGVPLAGIVLAAGVPSLAQAHGWRVAAIAVGSAVLLMAAVWGLLYRDAPAQASGARPRSGFAWGLLRDPGVLSVSAFAAAGVAAQFCVLAYLILFLHERHGYPLVLAGFVMAATQVGSLIGRLGWGLLSDRLLRGARKPTLCGAGTLGTLMLVALAIVPLDAPLVAGAITTVLGATILAWQAQHQLAVAEIAGPTRAGQAVGLSMTILQLGAIAGPPLFGLLVDRTRSYETAWLAAAALVALSVAAMALAWRERR